jgi:hypothetical protein
MVEVPIRIKYNDVNSLQAELNVLFPEGNYQISVWISSKS